MNFYSMNYEKKTKCDLTTDRSAHMSMKRTHLNGKILKVFIETHKIPRKYSHYGQLFNGNIFFVAPSNSSIQTEIEKKAAHFIPEIMCV